MLPSEAPSAGPPTVQDSRLSQTLDSGTFPPVASPSGGTVHDVLPGGKPEAAVDQTRLLYAGANRLTTMRLATLDLPEGNAMRAIDFRAQRHRVDARASRPL